MIVTERLSITNIMVIQNSMCGGRAYLTDILKRWASRCYYMWLILKVKKGKCRSGTIKIKKLFKLNK